MGPTTPDVPAALARHGVAPDTGRAPRFRALAVRPLLGPLIASRCRHQGRYGQRTEPGLQGFLDTRGRCWYRAARNGPARFRRTDDATKVRGRRGRGALRHGGEGGGAAGGVVVAGTCQGQVGGDAAAFRAACEAACTRQGLETAVSPGLAGTEFTAECAGGRSAFVACPGA